MQCACGCNTEIDPKDKYGRPRKYVSGHNGRKYNNPTQYKREWNYRNKEARYQYKKAYWKARKDKLIAYKGGKCLDCGLEWNGKNRVVFQLHHLDPVEKDFNISNQVGNKAWETILHEADKCVLLCANCHFMRHGDENE